MKRFFAVVLAALMLATCFFAVSCDKEEPLAVSRSFLAGYENTVSMGEREMSMSGRVLMNLMNDGTLDLYVGFDGMGSQETAHYTGTYSFGENEEFDETITFTYTYGEGDGESATVTDAVIIDGIFETPFYMISNMTSSAIKFYETAPAAVDGDVYVGYMTKSGGMGSMVYAYALNLKQDGTFDVSIMQMASVMHVWGNTSGTYTVNGTDVTFNYNVVDDVGEVVAENYSSTGTNYTESTLSAGFNIAQASVSASPAAFIRVK